MKELDTPRRSPGGNIHPRSAMDAYIAAVEDLVEELRAEEPAIRQAAAVVASCLRKGGQVFVFGTGHSHLIALDAFFRAGGLVPVCPVLDPRLMLYEGAVESTRFERTPGLADEVLARYAIDPATDCMLVISNSGRNTVPTEMVAATRALGVPVISITSFAYARAVGGDRGLAESADVAIDNHCPPGDALVAVDDRLPRMGPGSTIAATVILQSILLSAAETLAADGMDVPVFISANMPGGTAHNAALIERWRPRNPHL